MKCTEALLRVYEYLDAELDLGDLDRIREHLAECPPCVREYGIEEEIKVLVQRSHPCDTAPSSLRLRVMSALQAKGAMPTSPLPPGGGSLPGFGGPTGAFGGGSPLGL